jgi:hypothetical protein
LEQPAGPFSGRLPRPRPAFPPQSGYGLIPELPFEQLPISGRVPGPSPAAAFRYDSEQVPVAGANRLPGRRGTWLLVALVTTAAVLAIVVVWSASGKPNPMPLRPVPPPFGLTATVTKTDYVAFRWRPPAGRAPSRYQIWMNGRPLVSVPGNETKYNITGLVPDRSYRFQVSGIRGGRSSRKTKVLMMRTLPTLSDARLEGVWASQSVITTITPQLPNDVFEISEKWASNWRFSPDCAVGACAVTLRGEIVNDRGKRMRFTVKLDRSGSAYTGLASVHVDVCTAQEAKSRSGLATIKIVVEQAGFAGATWVARKWSGTVSLRTPLTQHVGCPATSVIAATRS